MWKDSFQHGQPSLKSPEQLGIHKENNQGNRNLEGGSTVEILRCIHLQVRADSFETALNSTSKERSRQGYMVPPLSFNSPIRHQKDI